MYQLLYICIYVYMYYVNYQYEWMEQNRSISSHECLILLVWQHPPPHLTPLGIILFQEAQERISGDPAAGCQSNFNPQTVLFLRGPSFSDPWRIQRYWIPPGMEILDLGSCVASRVLIFSRMAERKCNSLGKRLPLWLPMTLDAFPGENKLPYLWMFSNWTVRGGHVSHA